MASKVHRFRYYNPKPQPIQCISLNKTCKHLAVARGDASIEIWDLNYAPYLLKFLPGVKNGSIEALGWVNNRLLSTGIGGALIEWDLERLCLKTSILLTGSSAWCLDVSKDNSLAAVGTEQGYVNLYDVENDDIIYKKLFDKQEGRILCCKFNSTGKLLVTGSIDAIRVWDAATGHAINRMSVSRRSKQVIVWCLEVLSDNTIVSGDSLGRLSFWDGDMGDQIESYTTHKADILSIAVSPDEKHLYCSGVDPIIMNFVKVNKTSDEHKEANWVKNVQRNIHEHDVRGLLVLYGEKLVSVGTDGYLTFSSYPPKWVMRSPPMIPASRSSVCCKKKLLLLRYRNHLEVWKLGSYSTDSGNVLVSNVPSKPVSTQTDQELEQDTSLAIISKSNYAQSTQVKRLKLTESPVKLLSIKAKKKFTLKCCVMSPNGELLFYCTALDGRMFKLENDEEQGNISVSKVMISGMPADGTDRVAFSDDSTIMVAHSVGSLLVFQVDLEAGATVVQTIQLSKQFKEKSLLHLYLSQPSPNGAEYLVAGDTQGALAVWKRSGKKFDFHIALPTYQCVPSAMTVDRRRETLVITYVDQKIVEYDLRGKKFTDWPGAALPPSWVTRDSAVLSITAHPTRDAMVFQDLTSLWIMERKPQASSEPLAKRQHMNDRRAGDMNLGLRVVPITYLADFHWLDKDEAVTVEVLRENIIMQLPPIAMTKR